MGRIQKHLMVVIILGIVTATFVSGLTSLLSFTSIGKGRSNAVLEKELEITAGYVDNLCMDVEHMVLSMTDRYMRDLPPVAAFRQPEGQAYLDDAKDLAKSFVAYNDNLAAVYYRINPEIATPKSGFFISKSSKNQEIVEQEPTDLSLFDPSDEKHVAWFYVPKEAGEPIWVSQYMNLNNGILTISYVAPIFAEDGTFIGVVGMDIDMSKVYERLSDVRIYNTGFAGLLSKNGELLYSSQTMNIPADDVQQIVNGQETVGSYTQQQKRMTLLSKELQNGDYLLIAIAEEDLYLNENRVIFTIVLTTLVVSLVVIGALTGVLHTIFNRFQADPMTKAKNRAAYVERISELEEQIKTRKSSFGVIVFDVNGLKRVNDEQGHSAGDKLLSDSVEEIRRFFPNEDLYRIGGDEFVLLSQRNKQIYLTYAFQKFQAEMMERKLQYREHPELIILSTGMAKFDPETDICYEDVFQRADKQMYGDKADFYAKNPHLDRRLRR